MRRHAISRLDPPTGHHDHLDGVLGAGHGLVEDEVRQTVAADVGSGVRGTPALLDALEG